MGIVKTLLVTVVLAVSVLASAGTARAWSPDDTDPAGVSWEWTAAPD
jgi:hypothetical protein